MTIEISHFKTGLATTTAMIVAVVLPHQTKRHDDLVLLACCPGSLIIAAIPRILIYAGVFASKCTHDCLD